MPAREKSSPQYPYGSTISNLIGSSPDKCETRRKSPPPPRSRQLSYTKQAVAGILGSVACRKRCRPLIRVHQTGSCSVLRNVRTLVSRALYGWRAKLPCGPKIPVMNKGINQMTQAPKKPDKPTDPPYPGGEDEDMKSGPEVKEPPVDETDDGPSNE